MSQYELLNNIKHQDLHVAVQRGEKFGDAVSGCAVYPTEFNELQKHYPILFQKQSTGEWLTIALFGFEKNENLFLENDKWLAPYIPAVIEREPFLIGYQQTSQHDQPTPVIHVDMKSARISQGISGEKVFLPQGGNSPYLERIIKVLNVVHEGVAESKRMLEAFTQLDLIEPITFEIELKNSAVYTVDNFATISKEKLLALSDAQIGTLHRSGLLRYAYLIIGSFTNIQTLVNQKNKTI